MVCPRRVEPPAVWGCDISYHEVPLGRVDVSLKKIRRFVEVVVDIVDLIGGDRSFLPSLLASFGCVPFCWVIYARNGRHCLAHNFAGLPDGQNPKQILQSNDERGSKASTPISLMDIASDPSHKFLSFFRNFPLGSRVPIVIDDDGRHRWDRRESNQSDSC